MKHSVTGILVLLGALAAPATAHPLSQGSLDVVIHPDRVVVHARVTVEEVSVTNMLATRDPLRPPPSGASDEAYGEHARYFVEHLHLTADGNPLTGRVVRVRPPARAQEQRATYELEYRPAASAGLSARRTP